MIRRTHVKQFDWWLGRVVVSKVVLLVLVGMIRVVVQPLASYPNTYTLFGKPAITSPPGRLSLQHIMTTPLLLKARQAAVRTVEGKYPP